MFAVDTVCTNEFDVAFHHIIMVKCKKCLIVLMALDSPSELYVNDASDMVALHQYLRQYYTTNDWLDRLLNELSLHAPGQP